MQTTRTRGWVVPLFCLLAGVAYLVAFWLGGNLGAGVVPFLIMFAYGALLLFGGRSETIRVLRGQPSDERWQMFDLRASAYTGFVVIAVLIGSFFYEVARGQFGNPYGLILAIGGLTYLASLLWLRWRA